jgi:hypothetical protein
MKRAAHVGIVANQNSAHPQMLPGKLQLLEHSFCGVLAIVQKNVYPLELLQYGRQNHGGSSFYPPPGRSLCFGNNPTGFLPFGQDCDAAVLIGRAGFRVGRKIRRNQFSVGIFFQSVENEDTRKSVQDSGFYEDIRPCCPNQSIDEDPVESEIKDTVKLLGRKLRDIRNRFLYFMYEPPVQQLSSILEQRRHPQKVCSFSKLKISLRNSVYLLFHMVRNPNM